MKVKLSIFLNKIRNLPLIVKIAGLVLTVTLLSLIVILLVSNKTATTQETSEESSNSNLLYSTLLFTPDSIPLDPARIQSVAVVLDLGANSAKKITFSIKFDPESVSLIDLVQKIDPTSALSNSFMTENITIAAAEGNATITLTLKEDAVEQMGRGEIAQLSFRIDPTYAGKLGFTIEDVTIESDNTEGKVLSPQTNILAVTKQ